MRRTEVVVLGEALVDLVCERDGERWTAHLGGGPFTVARTLARLGCPVSFVGGLSRDRFGTRLAATLVADGVRLDHAPRTDLPTTLALAEIDGAGIADYRFYAEATAAPQVDPASAEVAAREDAVAALHVGTLALVLEPLAGAVRRAVAAVAPEVLVMLDPNCRPALIADRDAYVAGLRGLLARVDVVKASTADLAWLAPGRDPVAVVTEWRAPGAVAIVTDGPHDVVLVGHGGERRQIAVPAVDVVDTIGAGDVFGATWLAAWLRERRGRPDLGDLDAVAAAAQDAAAVAAAACTRAGAEPPVAGEAR